MKKTQLTQDDLEKLDAARGLDLHQSFKDRPNQNNSALRPSVATYNKLVRSSAYCGTFIKPIGATN